MLRIMKQFLQGKRKKITFGDIASDALPTHLAIIMDGNGRWAQQRGMPRAAGHRAGAESLRGVVNVCGELGIRYLTVYAFSTENWKRPQEEIDALMGLLVEYIEKELDALKKNKVRIKAIGNIEQLPPSAYTRIKKAEEETAHNERLFLQIALNYGGRRDIIQAVQKIAADVVAGKLPIEQIDDGSFAGYLATNGLPDPDLLIRTAGEKRLSNYLLWECAYTEFWFTDVFWPDFRSVDLYQAIYDFQHRQRRFGGLHEQSK